MKQKIYRITVTFLALLLLGVGAVKAYDTYMRVTNGSNYILFNTANMTRDRQIILPDADITLSSTTTSGTGVAGALTYWLTSQSLSYASSVTFDASNGNLNIDSGILFVDAVNNRVGVGTTTPVGALEVLGGPAVTAPFASSVRISNGNIYLSNSSTINFGNAAGTSFQPILTRGSDNNMRLRAGSGRTIITGDTGSRTLIGAGDGDVSSIGVAIGGVQFFSSSTVQSAARTSVLVSAHPNQEASVPLFYIQNPTGGNLFHLTTSATTASSTLTIGSNTATTTLDLRNALVKDRKMWFAPYQGGFAVAATSNAAPASSTLLLHEFDITSVCVADGLAIIQGSGATTADEFAFGIFGPVVTEDTATGTTKLVQATSTFNGVSANAATLIPFSSTTLNPGRYYVGLQFSTTSITYMRHSNQTQVAGWLGTMTVPGGYSSTLPTSITSFTSTGSNGAGIRLRCSL